jgi:hypothetical protein
MLSCVIGFIYATALALNYALSTLFPRFILDRNGALYLSRYYLFGLPKMSDGSYPFEPKGAFREGARERKLFGVAPYLHQIHLSDNAGALHNHPWSWSFSLILWRGYYEDRLISSLEIKRRRVWPGQINFLRGIDYHRIDLIKGKPAWTLFVTGPRVSNWGFWAKNGFVPFKNFLNGRAREKSDDLQA